MSLNVTILIRKNSNVQSFRVRNVGNIALANALRQHEIGGAGIDVLDVEPPPVDHPLLAGDIPNLILTPHIAWASVEARQRVIDHVAENLKKWLTFYQNQK